MEIQPAVAFNPAGGAVRGDRPRESDEAHRAEDSAIERREAERASETQDSDNRAEEARRRRQADSNRVDLSV